MSEPLKTQQSPDNMTLRNYFDTYFLTEREISIVYQGTLDRALRKFEKHLGYKARLVDLTDANVNGWLTSMAEGGSLPATQSSYKRAFCSIWRSAAERDLVEPPKRIRRIKNLLPIVTTWNLDELQKLLAIAEKVGVERGFNWPLFIRVAYETGLRLSDVLTLDRDNFSDDGVIVVRQRKTGWPLVCKVHPSTLRDVLEWAPFSGPVFRWPGSADRRQFFIRFKALVCLAGIRLGTSRWLRRSGATNVEMHTPGSAMGHLGHRTPGLAYKHYVDPTQLAFNRPTPVEL